MYVEAVRMFFSDLLCLSCHLGLLTTYWCEHNHPCPCFVIGSGNLVTP